MANARIVPMSKILEDIDGAFLDGAPFTGVAFEENTLGRSELTYVRGIQDGAARDWYPDGQLKAVSWFRNGVCYFEEEWYPSGVKKSEVEYEQGVLVRRTTWTTDGSLQPDAGR